MYIYLTNGKSLVSGPKIIPVVGILALSAPGYWGLVVPRGGGVVRTCTSGNVQRGLI